MPSRPGIRLHYTDKQGQNLVSPKTFSSLTYYETLGTPHATDILTSVSGSARPGGRPASAKTSLSQDGAKSDEQTISHDRVEFVGSADRVAKSGVLSNQQVLTAAVASSNISSRPGNSLRFLVSRVEFGVNTMSFLVASALPTLSSNTEGTKAVKQPDLSSTQAKFYGDGKWYSAILGEATANGRLVQFLGYEDDGWQVGIVVWTRCRAR